MSLAGVTKPERPIEVQIPAKKQIEALFKWRQMQTTTDPTH